MAVQATGSIVFHRITNGKTVSFSLSSNASTKQSHYKDSGTFFPDYGKTPLVITPILAGQGTGGKNLVSGQCSWKMDGQPLPASGFSVGTTAPFALTVSRNLDGASHIITCEYAFRSDAVHAPVLLTAQIPLNRDEVAGSAVRADIAYVSGGTHFSTRGGGEVKLKFEGRMIRGGVEDKTDVEYHWYITKPNGDFMEITGPSAPAGSGLPEGNLFVLGANKKTIEVSSKAVVNVANLKLMVKDTDADSGTTGMTSEEVVGLVDETDDLKVMVKFVRSSGMDEAVPNATYPVVIYVQQDGTPWEDALYNGKLFSVYRATQVGDKDSTFSPPASDFPGWSFSTSTHEISRAFSGGDGTEANRTLVFTPEHLIKEAVSTIFNIKVDF